MSLGVARWEALKQNQYIQYLCAEMFLEEIRMIDRSTQTYNFDLSFDFTMIRTKASYVAIPACIPGGGWPQEAVLVFPRH